MSKLQIISFGIILLIGAWLRLHKFNHVPENLYVDEVAMYIDAVSVAQSGKDFHGNDWWQVIYPSYGDYKQSVYIWLASAVVALVGPHSWIVRFPSLVAGLATIVIAAVIAVELFAAEKKEKLWIGVATAAIVAFSPWSIHFSRVGFEAHLGQLLLASSLLCYIKGFKSKWWLVPAIVLATLSTYSYYSVRFVVPVLFVAYFLLKVVSEKKLSFKVISKKSMVLLFLPLIVYGASLYPLLHSTYYQKAQEFRLSTPSIITTDQHVIQSNIYRQQTGDIVVDRLFFHRYLLLARELLANYSDNLSLNFLFLTGDPNLRHGTGTHGIFLLPSLIFLLIGLYSLAKNQKKALFFLLIWWVVALLPASVPEETPHALRSLNGYVAVSAIIGYGAWYFFQLDLAKILGWASFSGMTIKSLLVIAYLLFLVQYLQYYFGIYPKLSKDAWFSSVQETAAVATAYADNKPIYAVRSGDKFFLWLIANSSYLGKQFAFDSNQGYLLTATDQFVTDTSLDSLPDSNFVLVLFGDTDADFINTAFSERIIASQKVDDLSGNSNYIFNIGP